MRSNIEWDVKHRGYRLNKQLFRRWRGYNGWCRLAW